VTPIFDAYAIYYDLLYQDKNYELEVNYVRGLLDKYRPAVGSSILDLGCGTGKHAEILSKMGYVVQGVDLSEAMVNAATSRKYLDCVVKPTFTMGDVRNIRLGKSYDFVISLFHVASYQTTSLDLKRMFLTASEHLKPGGIFIFDCWYGPGVLTDPPKARTKKMENDKFEVTRITKSELFPNTNLVDVNFSVSVLEKKTHKVSNISEIHTMRYLFKPEIDYLLGEVGLSSLGVFEWMMNKEADLQTWLAVFVVTKD